MFSFARRLRTGALALMISSVAFAATPKEQFVISLVGKVNDIVSINESALRSIAFAKFIRESADTNGLGKFIPGRYGKEMTPEQLKEFSDLINPCEIGAIFAKYVKEIPKDHTVKELSAGGKAGKVLLRYSVRGSDALLHFELIENGQSYSIENLNINPYGDLANIKRTEFTSQYSEFVQNGPDNKMTAFLDNKRTAQAACLAAINSSL
jgi:hypothetical protein